ncbi:(d)CMP kinase [Embleya sp. NPDC020630]|uniref:(d)CMP kinase n=1 Tax=Embleya sp. NPDC020630 TaxID=3363979 RepID=UPI0037B6D2C7
MILVPSEPPPRPWHVSIDGPTAAGKTTLATGLARASSGNVAAPGTLVLDTGLTYRAAALVLSRQPDLTSAAFDRALLHLPALWHGGDREHPGERLVLMWNDQDITDRLHTEHVTAHLPLIAGNAVWRDAILNRHTQLVSHSAPYNLITVGRDTTPTLAPASALAVHLTADLEIRRQRRHTQFAHSPDHSTAVGPETALDVRVRAALRTRPRTLHIDSTHLTETDVRTRVLDALTAHASAVPTDPDGTRESDDRRAAHGCRGPRRARAR